MEKKKLHIQIGRKLLEYVTYKEINVINSNKLHINIFQKFVLNYNCMIKALYIW